MRANKIYGFSEQESGSKTWDGWRRTVGEPPARGTNLHRRCLCYLEVAVVAVEFAAGLLAVLAGIGRTGAAGLPGVVAALR